MTAVETVTAVRRHRPAWHAATVEDVQAETPRARRIVLQVPTWPGSTAGQHLDLRLTADDGYQATRSYSVASTGDGTRVELAVDRVEDGEVSPFLVDALEVGDALEVHGPLGAWFVWEPTADGGPTQLIAGGSGVVPMVAMVRAHAAAQHPSPMRLLYAARTPEDVFFRRELDESVSHDAGLEVEYVFSRRSPAGSTRAPGRLTRLVLEEVALPAEVGPTVFVCGSTPFVEQVIRWLLDLGHPSDKIRAERFGGS
ncbi:ferredoxin reductase [Kineococcus sp. SYSU DK003]|uniref:ferredoxin reductase n=1 Tax=Kineococcus sp. SYSU DK003 TaxID=3383124 RepID=UPI003D7C7D5A